jgi:nuclear transport factor 2 (NTF2) superfamily protein
MNGSTLIRWKKQKCSLTYTQNSIWRSNDDFFHAVGAGSDFCICLLCYFAGGK